jgi:DNA repair protein RecN (Recombination protein N)
VLLELRVTNLGVIEDQSIVLGPGLTALTGETGAGKTLLVDAISLLVGGPADPALVAPGAAEARVEGRFERIGCGRDGAVETILTRVVPAGGRSRCYVDGRMVSAAQLLEIGQGLVDIHGQHAHQSLLAPGAPRRLLDRAAGIDASEVQHWRQTMRSLTQDQARLGGDARERARQLDLLSYQLEEIVTADLDDPGEDAALLEEEELLAGAAGLAQAAAEAWEALAGDDGIVERLGRVVATTATRRPLAPIHQRLVGLQDELADVAREGRHLAESVDDNPERLAWIGERRRVLTELRRKYGPSLEEVISYGMDLQGQVHELEAHDRRAAELEAEMERASKELAAAQERLTRDRRAAAPGLARAVEKELRALAMPRARFEIEVDPDPGREGVTWLFGANPGQPLLPLAKAASGGELARAMLATRLVVGPGGRSPDPDDPAPDSAPDPDPGPGPGPDPGPNPETLVFDEVDAGIGGEAAIAVGRALAALAADRQVLVVTHLAQVAAFASSQLEVAKKIHGGRRGEERTEARARVLDGEDRVVELARMLSGRPDSESARRHAAELLAGAQAPARPSPNSRRRRR